jgi:glucosamine 6-phosphate synthetase-like amidotransferase/phosphosugar isomerase protein
MTTTSPRDARTLDVLNLGADTASRSAGWSSPRTPNASRALHAQEIFEQPRTVENALRGRVDLGATARFGGLNLSAAELRAIDRIVIAASGTSWHAALVGEYLIEELAHLPVEVEFAHEFCYRNAPLEKNTILLVLSQSGETADTLAALREAKRRGHKALAIVNVVGSTIARESDGGIYMHAGPEIGVASTKASSPRSPFLRCSLCISDGCECSLPPVRWKSLRRWKPLPSRSPPASRTATR